MPIPSCHIGGVASFHLFHEVSCLFPPVVCCKRMNNEQLTDWEMNVLKVADKCVAHVKAEIKHKQMLSTDESTVKEFVVGYQ